VSTFWQTDDKDLLDVFEKFGQYIKEATRSRELEGLKEAKKIKGKEIEIEGKKLFINIDLY
jgi:hypothetical protein